MKVSFPFKDEQSFILLNNIVHSGTINPVLKKIIGLISKGTFEMADIKSILKGYDIESIDLIKEDTLNLLLTLVELTLQDGIITEKEMANIKVLKRIFKIKEGDFYNLKIDRVKVILNKQFQKLYSDNKIDSKEAILKAGIQELFDLSYDQFLELSEAEVRAAIDRGADLNDLDTFIRLN